LCQKRRGYLLYIYFHCFPQLHKLQGRRNRREEINIVDVNAADQVGDSAAMLAKYGTEEIAYAPSRVRRFLFCQNSSVTSVKSLLMIIGHTVHLCLTIGLLDPAGTHGIIYSVGPPPPLP